MIDGVLTRGERELWDKIHPDPYIGAWYCEPCSLVFRRTLPTSHGFPTRCLLLLTWRSVCMKQGSWLCCKKTLCCFGAVPYRPGGTLYQRNPPHPPVRSIARVHAEACTGCLTNAAHGTLL